LSNQAHKILAFATQGAGGNDEARLRTLLQNFSVDYFPFDRTNKKNSFLLLRKAIRAYSLVAMEGTGIAGGLALINSGKPYVLSSGDAVAPFVVAKQPLLAPLFNRYEHSLYANCRGFIGWTPYLAGRALSFGAPRAMTAAGWSPFRHPGTTLRKTLGIPEDALVIGIVGALDWNTRVNYCYGEELRRALKKVKRTDVYALIVGGGTGLAHLAGPRIILPGPVPRERIPDYLATMDVASLPQSCDQLGSFRYSTKLPEYLAAGLPIVTGQLPLAYDLDSGWMWRLPGNSPWDPVYIDALATLIGGLSPADLASRRAAVPSHLSIFDRDSQIERVTAMIGDVLATL
jgi:glycosyltransferase involved in cell wall biosynthesis